MQNAKKMNEIIQNEKILTVANMAGAIGENKIGKFSKVLDVVLGMSKLQQVYDDICADNTALNFEDTFLKVTNTHYTLHQNELNQIPKTGPLLIVANHPYGMLDGLIIVALIKRYRPDVRLMANQMLGVIPELNEILFGVDPFETKLSVRNNIASLKNAIGWLQQGNSVIVFPSGEVSHLHLKQKRIIDSNWSTTIGRIQRLTEATVVPVFFQGRNSPLFHIAGLINPWLRTMLLPREFARKCYRNTSVQVNVGQPVKSIQLAKFDNDSDKTEFLKFATYLLQSQTPEELGQQAIDPMAHGDPIHEPIASTILEAEVAALTDSHLLFENNRFKVLHAYAKEIPETLKEIGRLRETNFRLIGEGSGKALDLDRYDAHYLQLFIWDKQSSSIVASCRFAPVDKVLAEGGIKDLYTYSLFDFGKNFLNKLNPAIEFGRLFVDLSHPRKFHGLVLLWTGLLKWLVRNPQYKYYFGGISISRAYSSLSHNLLIDFCRRYYFDSDIAKHVKPRCPFIEHPLTKNKDIFNRLVTDFDLLSILLKQIDPHLPGVPMLFKKYQMFNYKVLCFNIDKEFSDVTDALAYGDLSSASMKTLKRFLTEEEAIGYLRYHGATENNT